jgi:hypothetical protein
MSAQTTEYIRVPVSATDSGAAIDPTSDTAQMAFVAAGAAPLVGDFKSATWETDTSTTPSTYYVRALVGPTGGVVTLTSNLYDIYIKIGDNPETVVQRTGAVWIF